MQFVFLLTRSISLEAIFIVVPCLALHDLILLFTRIINQSFAFSPGKIYILLIILKIKQIR